MSPVVRHDPVQILRMVSTMPYKRSCYSHKAERGNRKNGDRRLHQAEHLCRPPDRYTPPPFTAAGSTHASSAARAASRDAQSPPPPALRRPQPDVRPDRTLVEVTSTILRTVRPCATFPTFKQARHSDS